VDPTLFSAKNSTLKSLIRRAYDLEDYQISGGPAWTAADRYDVDARPESPSSPDQMMLMLRTLLADRFQLTSHRETKLLPLNVLSTGKGGVKFGPQFHPVSEGDTPAPRGKPIVNQLPFSRVTMRTFATYLHLNLSRDLVTGAMASPQDVPPVLDQTGLSGTYDIVLNTDGQSDWPDLLERQLGLRLELRKVPTEIFVIDNAAKPSGN
jgi:uncharacterized protein (TIGR03435 family)